MKKLDTIIGGKRFLLQTLVLSVLLAVVFAGANVLIDLYGLFRPINDRQIKVYNSERTSKYLLTYNYIPKKFNTVIIGTSLSANLDVRPYNDTSRYEIYNASVMGANVSELKPLVEMTIKGGIKQMIVCISPYMMKTSGSKEVELNKKTYFGALGSMDLYQTYVVAFIRTFNLLPRKFPQNQIDENGVNDYGILYKVKDVKAHVENQIEIHRNDELEIDSMAVQDLKDVFQMIEAGNVEYIAYFHPLPTELYMNGKANQERFRKIVKGIVPDTTRIIDFNSPERVSFTSDYSNYIDHGHLSDNGQSTVMGWLYEKMNSSFR